MEYTQILLSHNQLGIRMIEDTTVGRKRICIVATVPFAIKVFMRAHIDVLKADYDVTLVASDSAKALVQVSISGGTHIILEQIWSVIYCFFRRYWRTFAVFKTGLGCNH